MKKNITYITKSFSVFEQGDKLYYKLCQDGYQIFDGKSKVMVCGEMFFKEHFAWKSDDLRDIKINELLS